MNKINKLVVGVGILCLTSVSNAQTSASTAAQTSLNDGSGGLEEIVVTATKSGDVSAQKVPVSIQAISEEDMTRGAIQGFDDYSKLIAGLTTLNRGPDQTQIVIRGVTTGGVSYAHPQDQSTSGMYVDDTPVSDNGFNPDLDLFDVNRIEVLKGPQGTLFGAGAESGAIRIITNDVDLNKQSGAASASGAAVDGGDADYAAHAMINAPLIDDVLGIRASAFYDHEGGFIKNVYTDTNDSNPYHSEGGRLKGLWKVNDAFDIHASVIYQNLDAAGRPQVFAPGNPAITQYIAPGENFAVTGPYQIVKFLPDPFTDRFTLSSLIADYTLGSLHFVSSTSYQNRIFDNTLDDTYRTRKHFGVENIDGDPLDLAFLNDTDLNDIAQEFRVNQNLDNGIKWVGGLYFERHDIHFTQSAVAPGLDALAEKEGLPPASALGAQRNSEYDSNEADNTTQYAAFGEATIPLATQWSVILGERVFNYRQTSVFRFAGIANDGLTASNSSTSESGNTPKAELTYKPTDNATVYLSAAKGFRLGGTTEPLPVHGVFGEDCQADLDKVGLTAVPTKFDSDHLWSYEFGAKTSWLDNRLIVNAALFDIEWSNIQTFLTLPCGFSTVVNAGKARSRGGELETSWAPIRLLTLGLTASYTDAVLVESTPGLSANPGDRVPYVAKFSGNVSAELREPFGSQERSMFVRGVVSYLGSSFDQFAGFGNVQEMPAYADLNGSAGVTLGDWDLMVYGKNLTNRYIVTGVDTARNVPVTYTVAPPRTVGLEAKLRF